METLVISPKPSSTTLYLLHNQWLYSNENNESKLTSERRSKTPSENCPNGSEMWPIAVSLLSELQQKPLIYISHDVKPNSKTYEMKTTHRSNKNYISRDAKPAHNGGAVPQIYKGNKYNRVDQWTDVPVYTDIRSLKALSTDTVDYRKRKIIKTSAPYNDYVANKLNRMTKHHRADQRANLIWQKLWQKLHVDNQFFVEFESCDRRLQYSRGCSQVAFQALSILYCRSSNQGLIGTSDGNRRVKGRVSDVVFRNCKTSAKTICKGWNLRSSRRRYPNF